MEIPRHYCRGFACTGHSFAQLSWSRQPGKVSKMVISKEAALSPPKPATGYLTHRMRLTPNLSTPKVFSYVRTQALFFNKMRYLDGDFLPHPLKFLTRVVISQTNHGTILTNRSYSDDRGSLQMATPERNGCAGIRLF